MKVTLKGFKCHVDSTYEFTDNLTLISGPSGAGKSSIFSAIYWCLYGSLRGIYDHTGTVTQCHVLIETDRFFIYRQGRPNLLKYNFKGESVIYEDDVAQELIKREFGPKEVWLACAYNEQGSRCTLITSSNPERMEVLNNLSFSTDDPEACIERIDEEIKSVQKDLHTLQVTYNTEVEMINRELTTKPIGKYITSDSLPSLRISITDRKKELLAFQEKKLEQSRIKGIYYTLNEELKIKENNLEISLKKRQVNQVTLPLDTLRSKMKETKIHLEKLESERLEQSRLNGLYTSLFKDLRELENELSKIIEPLPITDSLIDVKNELDRKKYEFQHYTNVKSEQIMLKKMYDELVTNIVNKEKQSIPPTIDINALVIKINNLVQVITEEKKKKEEYDKLKVLHNEIVKILDNCDKEWRTKSSFTQEQLYEIKNKERLRDSNVNLAKLANIEYNKSVIINEISKLKRDLESAPIIEVKLKTIRKIRELQTELSKLPLLNDNVTTEMLNIAHTRYNEMRKGTECLSCPHCGKSVRYLNSKLLIGEAAPVSVEELKQAYEETTKLYSALEVKTKKENLLNELSKLSSEVNPNETLIPIDVNFTSERITLLEKIEVIDKELSSSLIEKLMLEESYRKRLDEFTSIPSSSFTTVTATTEDKEREYMNLKAEYDKEVENIKIHSNVTKEIFELKTRLSNIKLIDGLDVKCLDLEKNVTELVNKINDIEYMNKIGEKRRKVAQLTDEIAKINFLRKDDIEILHERTKNEYELIIKMIDDAEYFEEIEKKKGGINEIKIKIRDIILIPNIDSLCLDKEKEVKDLEHLLINSEYAQEMQKKITATESKRGNISVKHKDLMSLQGLRLTAINVECVQIQATVDAINASMNEILPLIFDNPITVCLRLYKELKSGTRTEKKTKAQVNLNVYYKGVEYDSLSSLSGGEGDRVSFALLLSLNRLSPSPFLILDEPFSSLNDELRTCCIEAIRKTVSPTKKVICINHEDVEGNYDSVIHLDG